MESQFNLTKIIEHYNLNTEQVASALFPKVQYPMRALTRIINNEAYLDTEQLQALAELAGVLVSDLFQINSWKSKSENGCLVFEHDNIKAKLNYNGILLTLYINNKPVKQELCLNNMKVTDFIRYIEQLSLTL